MIIRVKPSDLIERFIWDKYKSFCLRELNKEEVDKLIANNVEFTISEEDAFVIGLTNVLYTTELIYKFKQFMRETLENKSFIYDDVDGKQRLYINKQILLNSINTFKKKIPKDWKSLDIVFNKEFEKLVLVYDQFIENIENLDFVIEQEWPCVKYGQTKKLVNKI